jgi:hypothetical protein
MLLLLMKEIYIFRFLDELIKTTLTGMFSSDRRFEVVSKKQLK